jgi:hypothetical protein
LIQVRGPCPHRRTPRDGVCVRGGAADRAPLRPGAGAAIDPARARVDAEGRIGQRGGRHRACAIPKGLVVAQVGLSVLLLAGAGLFARSLYNLKTLHPGFQADQLLGFSLDPSLNGYSRERAIALFQQLEAQLALLPEVRSASASIIPLMTNSEWSSTVKVEGYKTKEGEDMNPSVNGVGPGFFATMGQPLVSGREFSVKDVTGAPRVAIINETMAKYFFGTDSPLGRHIGWGRDKNPEIEIVGVARDSKTTTLRQEAKRAVYVPYMQEEEIGAMTFYVRARGDASGVGASVRQVAQRVDPNLPIYDMKTMAVVLDESLSIERMVAALSVAFGGSRRCSPRSASTG